MGTESPSGSWLSRLPCRRNEIKTLEIQIELMQTPSNTVRRLTETEVNSSTYQEQVRDRGVPQSYPDEWLELRWIRPGQTSLIPLQCRRREKRKRRGFTSIQMLHAHTHTPLCHTQLSHNFVADFFHTQFCHTQLCHTKLFHTTLSRTTLSHTHAHTQLFNTQIFHTRLFHTQSFTHNFVTYNSFTHNTFTYTNLRTHIHTQHCRTQLLHPTSLAPSPFLPAFPISFSHLLVIIGRS